MIGKVIAWICCVVLQDDSIGPDPFYDLEQHALLGVANFYLECINHDVSHEYTAPIVAPTGKVSQLLPSFYLYLAFFLFPLL